MGLLIDARVQRDFPSALHLVSTPPNPVLATSGEMSEICSCVADSSRFQVS